MTSTRFRPERAGILNLWHFQHIELPFADGRLVLRGSNGAGKTKALELLFPLVLDGSLDPRRLDPFSSDGRRMRDNVLAAADASGHRAAVGYAWITFGRTSEAGAPEHVTVGIGVSGSHDRDRVDSWTFLTDRVPGTDMHLLDAEQRPLSRAALKEVLGADNVFDTVEAHRRAVDARLFGLGDERFHRMIEVVLQLRKPKLAALLDPERISLLLSQSLRPIDGEALDDVARGLAELERIADEIAGMERAVRSLDALHRDHATYLRAHARARLDALRHAQGNLDGLERELAENDLQRTDAERRTTEEEQGEHARREEVLGAEGEAAGLRQSDAYRAGGTLADRRQAVTNLRQAALHAGKREEDGGARSLVAKDQHDAAQRELVELERTVEAGAGQLRVAAPDAVGVLECDLTGDVSDVQVAVRAAVATRREALDAVRTALGAWETACVRTSDAAQIAARAVDDEQQARGAHQQAVASVEHARRTLGEAARAWSDGHKVVSREDLDAVLVRLADGERDEVAGLPSLVRERWEPRRFELVADEQRASTAVEEARTGLEELRAQRDRVAAAEEEAPPDSPWRTATRDGRAGAPLWRLADFAPHLDELERAGLEGALLAAGILDAWVDPPGVSRAIVVDDAFLVPVGDQEGPTLADVLVPDIADAIMCAHLLAVLRGIGLGRLDQVTVGVDASGRFRIGPLVGGFRSERARYVGATAREIERARRLDELDAAIAAADAELEARSSALRAVQATRAALEAGIRALPDVRPLLDALDSEASRLQRLDDAVDARRSADSSLAGRKREQDDADAHRRRTAASRRLPLERAGLDAAAGALAQFERDAVVHISKLEQLPRARERCSETQAHQLEAEEAASVARKENAEVRARLVQAEAELEAIEASFGIVYREVVSMIEAAERRAAEARALADDHHHKAGEARLEASRLGGARPQLEARRSDATAARSTAAAAVEAMFHPGFALVLDLGESPDIARLEKACADVSATEQQLKRVETALQNRFEALQKEAGARLRAILTLQHDLHLVEIEDEGREPSAVYAVRLSQRLADHRTLLADRERAIFEDHLLGTLCTALYQRLRAARAFAREADEELQRRPLASGVHFGLHWKPRQDVVQHEAVLLDVLRRDADHLGPGDLDLVRHALRDALKHLRTEMPSADQRALLESALDYRKWHRFSISLHRAGGQPVQELTKHRHAQLSGGEKAAALYAPLFAAARATFAGGYASAPRLVALDEAFEGIDALGRPELLAMTVAFDLDLLLTGYDLWLADASVPAAMHAQLHHDPGIHLAIAELVRWDGEVLENFGAPVVVREVG